MILGLIFLVGAIIVYFDFIEPVYEDAQKLKAEGLSLENLLNSEKQAITKVQSLISDYRGQGDLRQAVSLALPEGEDAVGALAQLYGLVQNSGLSLQSVSLAGGAGAQRIKSAEETRGGLVTRPIGTSVFQMKLAGSYGDLKTFLARLETNMRVFDLRSLSIQPGAISGGKFVQTPYAYDVSVATYHQEQ